MPGLTLEIAIALGAMAHRRGINSSLFSEKSVPSSRSEAELPAYLDDKRDDDCHRGIQLRCAEPNRLDGHAHRRRHAGAGGGDDSGRLRTAGRGGWVITPNLDQLRLFHQKPGLRGMYQQASLVLADGNGPWSGPADCRAPPCPNAWPVRKSFSA